VKIPNYDGVDILYAYPVPDISDYLWESCVVGSRLVFVFIYEYSSVNLHNVNTQPCLVTDEAA